MTESCAACTVNYPDDRFASGSVGPCQAVNEIKLVDVAEMGYTSEDKPYPRGELCIRGANVFSGYYKDPENTKKTIDAEGWLHTGDVAAIDSAGRFVIIDRVKVSSLHDSFKWSTVSDLHLLRGFLYSTPIHTLS